MSYTDLQQFLKALDEKGLLSTINTEVNPVLEITEIADRVSKRFGNALKFTNVKGSPYPLVINTMGTYERLCMGLGVNSLDEIADEIESFFNLSAYATLTGKIKAIPKLAPLPFIFPKKVKRAACQEVIESPDLNTLPVIQCWPEDGGKYITLPLVFTKDPESGQQNIGMYRMQIFDGQTTGMHWHLHKDGKEIYEKYRKLGKRMPVSVALGSDPATIYAATAPLPKMIDEMLFAGFLRKRPVELVKCVTNDLYVPAHAEFILEGYVDLDERRTEGPFGDHTGYYSLADEYPVFHLEKITRKKNPVYPTTIVGKPPMEDCYLGKATERIFRPLMKIQCPEIVDIDFPLEGVFHNCAIVSLKKAFPRHANKLLYALWGLGQMMYTKMIIVVDSDVDVHNYAAVAEAVKQHVTCANHLILTEGPLDALDHASNRAFQGFRLGIDATTKRADETCETEMDDAAETSTGEAALESGPSVLEIHPFDKVEKGCHVHAHLSALMHESGSQANIVIVVDPNIDPKDYSTVAWKVFNNIDPKRDILIGRTPSGKLFIGIDATKKGPEDGLMRPWPNDIEMDGATVRMVTEKWRTYGIDG